MADSTITNLSSVDALALDDYLVVDDTSAPATTKTKKASLSQLQALLNPTDIEVFTDITDTPASYAGAAGYKVKVNDTEDGLIFENGEAYGSLYVVDNTTPQAITTSWTAFVPVGAQPCVFSRVSYDILSGSLTILEDGIYNVFMGLSFSGGNNIEFQFAVAKNGVPIPSSRFARKMGSAGDVGAGSVLSLCELVAGDVLSSVVKASANTNLTIQHGQFNIHRVDH